MGKIRLPKIRLNLDDLKAKAVEEVLNAEKIGGPGEEKFDRAVEGVRKWLDDQLKFGPGLVGTTAEVLTDAVLYILAGPVVEEVWAQLFGKGKA